jgi:hypothetical protein
MKFIPDLNNEDFFQKPNPNIFFQSYQGPKYLIFEKRIITFVIKYNFPILKYN